MKRVYNLGHRVIAHILFIILLLQNCSNSNTSTTSMKQQCSSGELVLTNQPGGNADCIQGQPYGNGDMLIPHIVEGDSKEKKKDENGIKMADFSNHQRLLELAIEGDPEAQLKLGEKAYQTWQHQHKEEAYIEAKVWLGKAAAGGHKSAISLLDNIEKGKKRKRE